MASINDLKRPQSSNEIILDATKPETIAEHIEPKVVAKTAQPVRKKQPIKERVEANLSSLPEDTSDKEFIRESPVKDILEGENSMFGQYIKNKQKEMEEWIEEKEDEAAIAEENEELENEEETIDDLFDTSDLENDEYIESDSDNFDMMEDEMFETEESEEEESTEEYDEYTEDEEEILPYEVENVAVEKVENDIELDENTSTNLKFEDESDNDSEENDEDEMIKHLQKLATEKLKPISQNMDISSFTIIKKPTTNTKFLQQQNVKVSKWVLPNQESIVQMKEFLGSEIEQLREFSEDSSSISSLSKRYKIIYDHIVSPKPSSYEAWLKSTPYTDIDHYFFAIYIACFKGANYIPVDCKNQKCNETFLTEDVPIMDMVKFDSDEEKEKFQSIYQSETSFANKNGLFTTSVIPLSNNIAAGFKEASIYNLIEIASLNESFKNKFSSMLEYIPFIDSLYIIDHENQQLIPIGYKAYTGDAAKTIKSKIQKFDSVLKTLSIAEFSPVKAYVRDIRNRKTGFKYIFPSVTCPKCGTESAEIEISAEEMVFTRYQLGSLVTTSLK